jgi:hypothetical protein
MKRLKVLGGLFLAISILSANAQKLPAIQKGGLRAPANIKIDGKATEWGGKFQAYNKSTDIFYSIANDDNNLYLAIQAVNPTIINKIIWGGVTFAIYNSNKKNDKDRVAITFPKYDKNNGQHYISLKNKPAVIKDTLKNNMQVDSFTHAINNQLAGMAKMIEVIGIKAITDSIISVYNEDGIKAVALFDKQTNYNYELAIPLKYLPGLYNKANQFSYQIKLNGATANNAVIQLTPNGRFMLVSVGNNAPYAMPVMSETKNIAYPTDLWGEYTLAK